MKRIIPLSVLSVVAASGFVFGIACHAPEFDDKLSSLNAPCANDDQCPIYLACHAAQCVPRCAGEGSSCDNGSGFYGYGGTCLGGLCLPSPTSTSGGGGSSGTSSGSSGASGCVLGGESVRTGVPALGTSSAAAVAIDDAHLFVSMQGTDSLGRPQSTLDAYPLDGGAVHNLVTSSNAGYAPQMIFRSGSWLYLTAPMASASANVLSRIPVSAADGTGATPELTNIPSTVAAYAPTVFYVGGYGGAYVRVDGETAVADSTILGYGSAISLTPDKAFYRAVSQSPYSDDGGTTDPSGPATGEIAFGSLAGGDTFRTGIILPDYATSFQVAGTTAFFQSPNGTLQSLDLTSATATPHTVHGPGLGNLYTDGKALFTVTNTDPGACSQLQQIDPNSGATKTLANVSTGYSGYYNTAFVGFYGGYYYWLAGAELRRVKIVD